jgi:hypothetical protein
MSRNVATADRRRALFKGMSWKDPMPIPDPPFDPLLVSPLPDRPCFPCGQRGWCQHRSPE